MRVGDIVKHVNFPNSKAGIVRSMDGREITVRWTMGFSGWHHLATYDMDELEQEIKR